MKTLYVLRHAKAERDAPSGEDHDRALDPRGRADAAKLGEMLDSRPDLIVTSSAKRTLETVENLTARWTEPPTIRTDETLYLASAPHLMETIHKLPDTAESAMLVGHNPGVEELAVQLANNVASKALRRMKGDFPTCALATFEISVDSWARVAPGLTRLISFSTPKDVATNHLADDTGA